MRVGSISREATCGSRFGAEALLLTSRFPSQIKRRFIFSVCETLPNTWHWQLDGRMFHKNTFPTEYINQLQELIQWKCRLD